MPHAELGQDWLPGPMQDAALLAKGGRVDCVYRHSATKDDPRLPGARSFRWLSSVGEGRADGPFWDLEGGEIVQASLYPGAKASRLKRVQIDRVCIKR